MAIISSRSLGIIQIRRWNSKSNGTCFIYLYLSSHQLPRLLGINVVSQPGIEPGTLLFQDTTKCTTLPRLLNVRYNHAQQLWELNIINASPHARGTVNESAKSCGRLTKLIWKYNQYFCDIRKIINYYYCLIPTNGHWKILHWYNAYKMVNWTYIPVLFIAACSSHMSSAPTLNRYNIIRDHNIGQTAYIYRTVQYIYIYM